VSATELMEQGVRAYTRGQLGEAERCWRDVLAIDPANERATSYLELLMGKLAQGAAATAGAGAPVPLPAPAGAPQAAAAPAAAALQAPVPLPNPAVQAPPVHAEPSLTPAPVGLSWTHPPDAGQSLADFESAAPAQSLAAAEYAPSGEYAPSPWDQGPAASPAVVLGDGVGLDLSSIAEQSDVRSLVPDVADLGGLKPAAQPRNEVEIWMQGARELFALGDFSGSLEMIEKILRVDPGHAEARDYLQQNESTLIAMYESKLGAVDIIPRLAIKPEEVMWLNLDHRAGFLLAQIDGTVSYEDLFALSGLPRLDTARILAMLLQEGVITS
jgi:hypothetical protein